MADIKIKYATKDNCKELAAVIATVIQNTPYYNDLAKQNEIKKFRSEKLAINIEKDKYSSLIAIEENKIVGFCLSRFDDCTIWLQWFGILKNCRNRNISNLLLNELEKTVALRGGHKIWCDCRPVNKAAIHILTNHGYRQLVTIPNHWYGQDSILWEKEISLTVGVQPTICQSYVQQVAASSRKHPVAYLITTSSKSIAWYVRSKHSVINSVSV